MSSKNSYRVVYGKYPEVTIEIPIDWGMDPFDAQNWRHNLVSLRWTNELALPDKKKILEDFYNYHYVMRKRNTLINTRAGDHTTSFRLNILRSLLIESKKSPAQFEGIAALCYKLMMEDVETLLSPEIYRRGHNHGLMADIAVLNAISELNISELTPHLRPVAQRGLATLLDMYTENFITKEHSISYQEYNYPIAIEFVKLCEKLNVETDAHIAGRLTEATRKILLFFTRKNGEFFPLGDSFRLPNKLIRTAHPELNPDKQLLNKTGSNGFRVFCSDGFFAYIMQTSRSRIHFVATCSWHSAHHKQDDELSFCLELDGDLIFDDSGYTDFCSRSTANTLRESSQHSAIRIKGRAFSPRSSSNGKSKIVHWKEDAHGFNLLASHERIEGIQLQRSFTLARNHLELQDEIKFQKEEISQQYSFHDFVLAPDVDARIDGRVLHITKQDRELGMLISQSHDGEWQREEIAYIPTKRSELRTTKRYSYFAPACARRSFSFLYYPR